MRGTIIGCVVAFLALLPRSDGGGVSLYRKWMEAYEKYLYQQMAANFEREERERNADICQNPSENEVSFEQTASEEAWTIQQHEEVHEVPVEETAPTEAVVETVPEITQPMVEVQPCNTVPIYAVNGAILDIGVQEYLYQRLCEANIGWFYHYAILIAYQESRFDPLAENKNGLDKGLFQFRIIYHPDLEWWNPYAQVDRFVLMMANRAANGKTAAEMISAHNVSDYAPYNQEYVSIVMSHEAGMVQIR